MASQPSLYSEERNLLRIQAWEQRNQETCQEKKAHPENVPLFGKPYKTSKWDELSCRIQRMLGSYEDIKSPVLNSGNIVPDLLANSNHVSISQLNQGQPTQASKSTEPSFHNGTDPTLTTTPKESTIKKTVCPRPGKKSHHNGTSATASQPSPTYPQGDGHANTLPSEHNVGDILDMESTRLPQETLSPSAEIQSPSHSSERDPRHATDRDDFQRRRESQSLSFVSPREASEMTKSQPKQSPDDSRLPQVTKGGTAPPQVFPPLLASKTASALLTQKPTAYVRPMDGQDQVVTESPDLKPSPEPYEPLPDKMDINSNLSKTLPGILETRSNEAHCVESILREMTHSWPPLLSTIQAPSSAQPSKSPSVDKVADDVQSTHPGEESSVNNQQSSACVVGAESASSTDSESSSGSESDNDCTNHKLPQSPRGSSTELKTEAAHGDWQLVNWIRSGQQNCNAEARCASKAQQLPPHFSKDTQEVVAKPTREDKFLGDNRVETLQCHEESKYHSPEQSTHKPPNQKSSDTYTSIHEKTVDNNHSTKPTRTLSPKNPEVASQVPQATRVGCTEDKTSSFSCRPKVKTKPKQSKRRSGTKMDCKIISESPPRSKQKEKCGNKVTVSVQCPSCVKSVNHCICPTPIPDQPNHKPPAASAEVSCRNAKTAPAKRQKGLKKPGAPQTSRKLVSSSRTPVASLLVKIDLNLLLRVPTVSSVYQGPSRVSSTAEKGVKVDHPVKAEPAKKNAKKRPAEMDTDTPRKKPKMEKTKGTLPSYTSIKSERFADAATDGKQNKSKKRSAPQKQQQPCRDPKEQSTVADLNQDADTQHKKSTKRNREHSKTPKQKAPKSSLTIKGSQQPCRGANRPILRFEDRHYPVKHYIKEAKKLKHKADAEPDKVSKAFDYLEAAMYFVESGVAMERDPETSKSSYSMFEDTVELIKFILKLKSSGDSSAVPSENDFTVLCMKCQSFLLMAMFRCKHKIASKYSKTLKTHFKNSKPSQDDSLCSSKSTNTPSPRSSMPSPGNATSSSSGPGSNHSGCGGHEALAAGAAVCSTASIPKLIQHIAISYVNITALFVSAHDIWEKAEALAHRSSGMLSELNAHMEPLSLSSSVKSMVQYTRQAVHWLRLECQSIK